MCSTQLLALLPLQQGGLFPLTCGLFHSSILIRSMIEDLLVRLTAEPLGKKFVQSLNIFHRLAFARQLSEGQERKVDMRSHNSTTKSTTAAVKKQQPGYINISSSSSTTAAANGRQDLPSTSLTSDETLSYNQKFVGGEGLPLIDRVSSPLNNILPRLASPAASH